MRGHPSNGITNQACEAEEGVKVLVIMVPCQYKTVQILCFSLKIKIFFFLLLRILIAFITIVQHTTDYFQGIL